MTKFPVHETITLRALDGTGLSATDVIMRRKKELSADWYRAKRDDDAGIVSVTYHNNDAEFPGEVSGHNPEEKTNE